jgi:hypothetical protein
MSQSNNNNNSNNEPQEQKQQQSQNTSVDNFLMIYENLKYVENYPEEKRQQFKSASMKLSRNHPRVFNRLFSGDMQQVKQTMQELKNMNDAELKAILDNEEVIK